MEKNILRNRSYSIIREISNISDRIVANNKYPNSYELKELESKCNELVVLMKSAKEYDEHYKY